MQLVKARASDAEVSAAVASHAGAADPHTGYRLESADHNHQSTGLQGGQLNAVSALTAAFTQWNPTVTQGGAVSTFSTDQCWYIQIGKLVLFYGKLIVNNAGAAAGANDITITAPVAGANRSTALMVGKGAIFDASANLNYRANLAFHQSAANIFALSPTNTTTDGWLGATQFTAALATGDVIHFAGHYEAA